MAVNLTPPSRMTGTAEQQLNGLYSYLYQLVEALNVNMGNSTGAGGGTALYTGGQYGGLVSASGSGIDLDKASKTYQDLKALIIKTATEVTSNIRKVVTEISHEYIAQSEFGTYEEYLLNKITQGADGVLMEWNMVNGITTSVAEFNQYIAESDVYIQVGIVKYNDDGTVEAGVVIGKELTSVTVDGKELITSQNLYALFTAEELSFWQDGECRARYGMVEFMVEKGYIDEVTTSLLQSETFGAQLILNDAMLAAIAEKINLTANESIQLVVQNTPAKELRTGTTVTITDKMFHVNSPETRFSIPSPESEDGKEIVSIDDEGLRTTVLNADEIHSDSVVGAAAPADYAPATAGDLQVILVEISGKWMTGDINIDASALTEGSVEIKGLHGFGKLTISGGTLNAVSVKDCSCIVVINGTKLSITGVAATVDNAQLHLKSVLFDASIGAEARNGAKLLLDSCTGGTSIIMHVYDVSVAKLMTSKPSGNLGTIEGELYSYASFDSGSSGGGGSGSGGGIFVPTGSSVSSATIKASKTRTWGGSWLSAGTFGAALYQGTTGGGTLRRGCMWFDLSSLSGKTIVSATLTLKRYSGIGGGGSVIIGLYGTSATTDSGTPAIGSKVGELSLANGASGVIDVTNAVKSMISGSLGGLMIYDSRTGTFDGKTYTYGYAKLYGTDTSTAPSLAIKYK